MKKAIVLVLFLLLSINPYCFAGRSIDLPFSLNFDVMDATVIQGEWILVVNGFELDENPHLLLDVENWITLIMPPSSRP